MQATFKVQRFNKLITLKCMKFDFSEYFILLTAPMACGKETKKLDKVFIALNINSKKSLRKLLQVEKRKHYPIFRQFQRHM